MPTNSVNDTTSQEGEQWLRLSPWSIVHFVVTNVRIVINNAIALVPLIYGAYQFGDISYIWLGAALIVAGIVVTALLRY